MKILITGSGGLIGQALLPELIKAGHEVAMLVRQKGKSSTSQGPAIYWEPASGDLDLDAMRKWGRPDALIHLAGKNIASGRWSEQQKQEIRDSRVRATELLSESLLKHQLTPKTYLAASATGIYGDREDEILDEQSSAGSDFLASVTNDWEGAATSLQKAGTRMVWLRIGMVLSRNGGALTKMLPAFKLGLAGKLGSGDQWVSWIHIQDLVTVFLRMLENDSVSGVINTVSPHPVRNTEFTNALGEALHRPTFLPTPAAFLKLAFGQVADDVLLASQRTLPRRLQEMGHEFKFPTIKEAFRDLFPQ